MAQAYSMMKVPLNLSSNSWHEKRHFKSSTRRIIHATHSSSSDIFHGKNVLFYTAIFHSYPYFFWKAIFHSPICYPTFTFPFLLGSNSLNMSGVAETYFSITISLITSVVPACGRPPSPLSPPNIISHVWQLLSWKTAVMASATQRSTHERGIGKLNDYHLKAQTPNYTDPWPVAGRVRSRWTFLSSCKNRAEQLSRLLFFAMFFGIRSRSGHLKQMKHLWVIAAPWIVNGARNAGRWTPFLCVCPHVYIECLSVIVSQVLWHWE